MLLFLIEQFCILTAMEKFYVLLLLLASAFPAAAQQSPAANSQDTNPVKAENSAAPSLPDAPSTLFIQSKRLTVKPSQLPYFPLTPREKFFLWLDHTHSPYLLFSVILDASFAQAIGQWGQFGGGFAGYGKRMATTLVDTEDAGFLDVYLFPALLHQDPRYFALRRGRWQGRAFYAASRVFVTRKDEGDDTVNSSEVLGRLVARSVENAYFPSHERGFRVTLTGTAEGLASDAGAKVLREFWPDFGRLFRKHEPEKLRKLEEQLPPKVLQSDDDE